MSYRQILNVVYAMHIKNMDPEQRAGFDRALNDTPDGRNQKAERRARMAAQGIEGIEVRG